jgi:putative hydrolase of the HAD superfamily
MANFQVIFFDLDDTLYSSNNGVWDAIAGRIHKYMIHRLGILHEDAKILRRDFLKEYGTTLNGLMFHYNVDPNDYVDYVHDIPVEQLIHPNPALKSMLQRLPQHRVIFTNASFEHAERVLKALDVREEFAQIIDLFALELINKPQKLAYRRALDLTGRVPPQSCIMIDDRAENLLPAAELGFTTVLVGRKPRPLEIDFCIDEVTDLLRALPSLTEKD